MEEKANSSPPHYERPQIYQDVNSKPTIILIFTLSHVTVCVMVFVYTSYAMHDHDEVRKNAD